MIFYVFKIRTANALFGGLQSHLPDLGVFRVLGRVINICTFDIFCPLYFMGKKRRLHLASAPWLGLGQVRQGCGWRQDGRVWSYRWDAWNTCPCEWSYVQLIDKQDGYVQERSMTAN